MFPFSIHSILEQLTFNAKEPLIFTSGLFLYLFLCFMLVYATLQKEHRAKIIFVTLFSLYFYYKSSGEYFLLLLLTTLVDFSLASFMHRTKEPFDRKLLMLCSVVFNLGVLLYFKYTNFFYEISCMIQGSKFEPFDIILPVGVSFFTFQSMSYTIDVYRGKLEPLKNVIDYAFFVSFFPQLVAGPIVRAADFIPQIFKPVLVTKSMIGEAIFLILGGLFKKAVIADYISINFVDRVFDNPSLYSGLENLFAVYGYALQIYCDFSGYSDMAIGIALLIGFRFNINFDSPYQSGNITEFWRRWHISLSSWLKDYLYISLGGNRNGRWKTYRNLFLTMLLGGLWHGAAFRYIIWGALHGLALGAHKYYLEVSGADKGINRLNAGQTFPWTKALFTLLTFHFVCFCWIFFRADSLDVVWRMLYQIGFDFKGQIFLDFIQGYSIVLGLMVIGYVLHFVPKAQELWASAQVQKLHWVVQSLLVVVMIYIVIQFKSADVQPFIYFQF